MKVKVKVLRNFINKYSKKRHKKGDILEISKKRLEEINSTSFGILVEEIEKEKVAAEPAKDEKPKEKESDETNEAVEGDVPKKGEEKKSTKK